MSKYHTSNTFATTEELRTAAAIHIEKTIWTLACQFFFTFGLILLTTFVSAIHDFVLRYILHVLGLGIAGSLIMVLVISFSERKTDLQLAVFTFFETLVICAGSLIYSEDTIVLGLLVTIGLASGLACYGITTTHNFLSLGPALFSALTMLCTMGLMNLFIQAPLMHVVGMYFGIMLFSAYIIYDVQFYLTEKCKDMAFIKDDLYIDAALNIYLDVLNILLRVWEFIAMVRGDKKGPSAKTTAKAK